MKIVQITIKYIDGKANISIDQLEREDCNNTERKAADVVEKMIVNAFKRAPLPEGLMLTITKTELPHA
jgi:hypothetical protein